MKKRTLFFVIIFVLSLLISGCDRDHPTPIEALTEFPGLVEGMDLQDLEVYQQFDISGGTVILYSVPDEDSGERTLAGTFVTPEDNGWRAQSSGWTGYSESDAFVVSGIAGGNVTDLTTVFGLSNKGKSVRIEWSDGQIDLVPVVDGSFVFSRPETVTFKQVELIGENGAVLDSKVYD